VVLDQASEPISSAKEDAPAVAEPTDAVFDEWILQDMVIKQQSWTERQHFSFNLVGISAQRADSSQVLQTAQAAMSSSAYREEQRKKEAHSIGRSMARQMEG
jgi:hypothetical protein